MNPISPILDQPHIIDSELLPAGPINRLANQDLACLVDAASDPHGIVWPWAGGVYARHIRLVISDWQDGVLTPMAVRFFPGHQETIAGAEGMIVTKRLVMPWKCPEDRALLWLLECQAEGDRLLKLEIDIDWGEPLTQHMVDGLLLAQHNPEAPRGIYSQRNAESTRVFGNPHGRPDEVYLDDPQRARLVYHVLVNGIVEVPLLLTMSDVGEQVAWNAFLALRDVEQIYDASTEHWDRLLHTGRLWTPEPAFNLAVHTARLTAVRQVQRLRTGWAPSSRRLDEFPALVSAWDTLDPVVSHNLLATLRRLAGEYEGRLPATVPVLPRQRAAEEAAPESILDPNHCYVATVHAHWRHRGDGTLVVKHWEALRQCVEAVLQLQWRSRQGLTTEQVRVLAATLAQAAELAIVAGDAIDSARWQSEVEHLAPRAGAAPGMTSAGVPGAGDWVQRYGWNAATDRPFHFQTPAGAIALASEAVWIGCGLQWQAGDLWVEPAWPAGWPWWALLSLPLGENRYASLLWDGATLHTTQPVRSSLPVQQHKRIEILHAGEFDFDPIFELTRDSSSGDTSRKQQFRPVFR
jgi:hypothetical protein